MMNQDPTNLDARGCTFNDVDGDQIINVNNYHADHAGTKNHLKLFCAQLMYKLMISLYPRHFGQVQCP
jgi:hypothetical protein